MHTPLLHINTCINQCFNLNITCQLLFFHDVYSKLNYNQIIILINYTVGIEFVERVALNSHCLGVSILLFPLYTLQYETTTYTLGTMDCCGQCSYANQLQWSHKFWWEWVLMYNTLLCSMNNYNNYNKGYIHDQIASYYGLAVA